MDAETLKLAAADMLARVAVDPRLDAPDRARWSEVLRALVDRAFPAFGGPPTIEEVERGLVRWAVRINRDEVVFAEATTDNGRIRLAARGWWLWSDNPAWSALRCRPVDADGNTVPRPNATPTTTERP